MTDLEIKKVIGSWRISIEGYWRGNFENRFQAVWVVNYIRGGRWSPKVSIEEYEQAIKVFNRCWYKKNSQ